MRYPSFIEKGNTIGFVAPSFGCAGEPYYSAFQNSLKKWNALGFKTELGFNCYASDGAWSAEHGAELRFACGSLGITSFLQRCHQVFVAGDQHTGLCPLVGAPFALAGAFGRLDQIVAVLFAENAALLSVLPEEAVPAICRAGSMVADTVHRDGQNFFHW